ncbi:MAG: translation initiation factor IF-2 [Cellvibrionaceae bacterium]|jgi:translation initiation factor IF-2
MTDVTVQSLAKSVGISADRLLNQMKEAGLSHNLADDLVSDEEKKILLASLKKSEISENDAPKKIVLKRKTTKTLKVGSGSSRKTVNIEVRKKRVYKKPDSSVEETESNPATEAQQVEQKPAPAIAAPNGELVDDAESKRQAAQEARRKLEAEEKHRREDTKAQAARDSAGQKGEAPEAKQNQATVKTSDADAEAKQKEEHGKFSNKKDKLVDETKEEARKNKPVRKKGLGPKKNNHKIDINRLNENYEEVEVMRKRSSRVARTNKHGFKKPTEKVTLTVEITENMSIGELASKMNIKANALIKELTKLGIMASINEPLDQEAAELVVEELGHNPVLVSSNAVEEKLRKDLSTTGEKIGRAPVVTVMGHVDHGKTSLLDFIRKTKVVSGEAGGITQHIGAYQVKTAIGDITFLDTPGHAAFTEMRARGAQCTDIVILVVAADDSVMPQTEEAIQHARAAGVQIIVAVSKCDKESADPERVKNELAAKDVIPEDWGGNVQFVNVSSHTGEGIDTLLEAVSLQAELLELTAEEDSPAKGTVIESRIEKGRGVVATVLVQSGTLKYGDTLLAGESYGRVRAMTNELAQTIKTSGPSTPVEILGLDSPPKAGDEFVIVPDERRAREVAEHRADRERQERTKRQQKINLENIFAGMDSAEKKILSVVLKADVRGSLEAIIQALNEIGNDEALINVVSSGVGGITANDVNLALTSGAVIIGFNVRTDSTARKIAETESVDVRYYSIIYQLLDDLKNALEGMLDPELVEKIVGVAEVRDVFSSPKFGQVAGCMVTEGTIYRNKPIRVLRDHVVIYEGQLESLRRFKDDVSEVRNGMECGVGVKNYDVKVGDQIEVYEVTEVKRNL